MREKAFAAYAVVTGICLLVWLLGLVPLFALDRSCTGAECLGLLASMSYPLLAVPALYLARTRRNNLWLLLSVPQTALYLTGLFYLGIILSLS